MIPAKWRPWALVLLALALFVPLFMTGGLRGFDFWWWMTTNALVLVNLSFLLDRKYTSVLREDMSQNALAKIGMGFVAAIFLYFVFAAGNYLAQMLPFAKSGIAGVYGLKHGISSARIAFLMVLVIGPGEEILWRGYFQRVFGIAYGPFIGMVIATFFYTAMHIASMNIMLIAAAGICGVFWGLLYLKYRSVLLNVVSHTAWDIAVFLLFPFT